MKRTYVDKVIEDMQEDIEQLEITAKYLLESIKDTPDVNKIESGKLELRLKPVDSENLMNIISNSVKYSPDDGEVDLYMELDNMRILLVEDNLLNRKIAASILEKQGAKVYCAYNGKQGVNMFKESTEGYYDIILMDICMPVMDGMEATRAIRRCRRKDAATIPISAMTANVFEDEIDECKKAGMNGYIAKPIEPDKMFRLIYELTKRQ